MLVRTTSGGLINSERRKHRYLGDDQLSARVAHTWAALSNACHYHSYELVPTAGELEGWIETMDAFAGSCETLLD